jgi:hypothetical protein
MMHTVRWCCISELPVVRKSHGLVLATDSTPKRQRVTRRRARVTYPSDEEWNLSDVEWTPNYDLGGTGKKKGTRLRAGRH